MNILLTGANGFVGSNIYNSLCVKHNITTIPWQEIKSDLLFSNIDVIIHCAAVSAVEKNMSDGQLEQLYQSNVTITESLAQSGVASGVKKFIYISTIKVYGEGNNNSPYFVNSHENPKSYYGKSKLEAEIALKRVCLNSKGMDFVILRPPLIYGPNVKGNFMSLLNLTKRTIPLPFGAISTNRRSLLYVGNLTDLISRCLYHPKAANQVFLISDEKPLSTYEMVELMAKVQNVKVILINIPILIIKLLGFITCKSDIFLRLIDSLEVDISVTQKTLDWKPPFSVEEGFLKCVENKKGKK